MAYQPVPSRRRGSPLIPQRQLVIPSNKSRHCESQAWQSTCQTVIPNLFRNLIITLCILFSVSLCYAKDVEFSIESKIGYEDLYIGEYVFKKQVNSNSLNKLSQLDWKTELLFFEQQVNLQIKKVILSAGIKTSALLPGGIMEDFDWVNPATTKNTHYSKHNLQLENDFSFFVAFNVNLLDSESKRFNSYLKYKFKNIKMVGVDGYRTYASEGWIKKEMYGKVIAYNPCYDSFFLGINAIFDFTKKLSFSNSIEFNVFLLGSFLDNHFDVNKSTDYLDLIQGFGGINIQNSFFYSLSKNFSLSLGLNLNILPIYYGKSYSKNTYATIWQLAGNGLGGFSSTSKNITLGIKLTF